MLAAASTIAFILACGSALAGDRGPLPQTGKDHPEVTKGAKESGAMDIRTTGTNRSSNGSPSSRPAAKQGPQSNPSRANDTPK